MVTLFLKKGENGSREIGVSVLKIAPQFFKESRVAHVLPFCQKKKANMKYKVH